jgi:hypothetical protein
MEVTISKQTPMETLIQRNNKPLIKAVKIIIIFRIIM